MEMFMSGQIISCFAHHGLRRVGHRPQRDLGVQVVRQLGDKVALDGELVGEEGEVVGQLVVAGDDHPVAGLVKLRPPSSTKYLQNVQDADINKTASLRVVDLKRVYDLPARPDRLLPHLGRGGAGADDVPARAGAGEGSEPGGQH